MVDTTFHDYAARAGWTPDTQVCVLLRTSRTRATRPGSKTSSTANSRRKSLSARS